MAAELDEKGVWNSFPSNEVDDDVFSGSSLTSPDDEVLTSPSISSAASSLPRSTASSSSSSSSASSSSGASASGSAVVAASADLVLPDAAPALSLSDRFTLHRRLAESLFGDVYLATDRSTGRKVAIKMSTLSLLAKHQSRRGVFVFESPVNEAQVLRALSPHPNIVSLVVAQNHREMHWLVQEYLGGGELFTHLHTATYFKDALARRFFTQLLSALAHMHRRYVCHLDISLENILLDGDGSLKLCDFGLAQFFHKKSSTFDGSKFRPGKCAYMAPEIYQGLPFDGPKADIFSAGVVLFSLLVGQPPFEVPNAETDNRYHLISIGATRQMIHALGLCQRVCREAVELMTLMMHPEGSKRPSAAEVLNHAWVKGRATPYQCSHDGEVPPSMTVEVAVEEP